MGGQGFAGRARAALQDETLRAATALTADRLRGGKAAAQEVLGNWEEWRRRGEEIRTRTIAQLDRHLMRFVQECERRGGVVHAAPTAEDAVRIVLDIIKDEGGTRIAKSKSMLAEEIHLNEHLEAAGYSVIETDLGEYIIQLAHETPSHIIIPAIHKDRRQIAGLFSAVTGEQVPEDTQALAGIARRILRREFLHADIGITGCNFAIAETGSLSLFTNEGNGRMVTTLPRVQITLVGIERIVPTWQDFEVMAALLARSATGQALTAYVSVTQSPRLGPEEDGPERLHVILVDNGRMAQLRDAEFRKALHCIRCGACLNVCPVYRQVGGHAYGSVYPGPIGAVLTPLLQQGSREGEDLPWASSLCGACAEACPVRIPLHDLLVRLRERTVTRTGGPGGTSERLAFRAWAGAFRRPRRLAVAAGSVRLLRRALGEKGFARLPAVREWARAREVPELPAKTFIELFDRMREREEDPR